MHNFLNEARMNVKKMTVEELAKVVVENKGSKRAAINFLQGYARTYYEEGSELYNKIQQVIKTLKDEKPTKEQAKKEWDDWNARTGWQRNQKSNDSTSDDFSGTSNKLKGMGITLTGKAIINGKTYTREELTKIIENHGGRVVPASSRTLYLLMNSLDSTSSKARFADKYKIPKITYQDFFNKFILGKELLQKHKGEN